MRRIFVNAIWTMKYANDLWISVRDRSRKRERQKESGRRKTWTVSNGHTQNFDSFDRCNKYLFIFNFNGSSDHVCSIVFPFEIHWNIEKNKTDNRLLFASCRCCNFVRIAIIVFALSTSFSVSTLFFDWWNETHSHM